MYLVHPYKKVTILRKMREGKEVRTVPWWSLSLGVITPVTLQRIPQRLSQLGSRSVNDGYSYDGSCFYSTYPRSRLLHPSYHGIESMSVSVDYSENRDEHRIIILV